MYESPLPVDEPLALFRVSCPVCRGNVWAGITEPPVDGETILDDHDCPGPADMSAQTAVSNPRALTPHPDDAKPLSQPVAPETLGRRQPISPASHPQG